MLDTIAYDEAKHRLLVGTGFIDNVPPEIWQYEVSGKRVLTQWFSYRKKNRERPIIGDRRRSSATIRRRGRIELVGGATFVAATILRLVQIAIGRDSCASGVQDRGMKGLGRPFRS